MVVLSLSMFGTLEKINEVEPWFLGLLEHSVILSRLSTDNGWREASTISAICSPTNDVSKPGQWLT